NGLLLGHACCFRGFCHDDSVLRCLKLYAGVQYGVQDVHDEVDDDEQQGDQHHVGDDHRTIQLVDAVDQQLAHARPRKHRLGDGGIGDQTAEFHAQHGHYGNQDVAQDVAAYDAAGLDALGAGETHVVL